MSIIKGIPVVLNVLTQTGVDAFGVPTYDSWQVTVENVLVTPLTSEEIAEDLAYYKKRTVYELSIPKGDANVWVNTTVEFFGKTWETIGMPREYIEANVPLRWNKKIRVAAYE